MGWSSGCLHPQIVRLCLPLQPCCAGSTTTRREPACCQSCTYWHTGKQLNVWYKAYLQEVRLGIGDDGQSTASNASSAQQNLRNKRGAEASCGNAHHLIEQYLQIPICCMKQHARCRAAGAQVNCKCSQGTRVACHTCEALTGLLSDSAPGFRFHCQRTWQGRTSLMALPWPYVFLPTQTLAPSCHQNLD